MDDTDSVLAEWARKQGLPTLEALRNISEHSVVQIPPVTGTFYSVRQLIALALDSLPRNPSEGGSK